MCRLGPQTRLWIYLFKNPNFRKSRHKYCEEIILKTPRLESRLESSARVNRMWLSAQTNSQQSGGFYLLLPLWRQQDLLWILCAISHNLPLSSSSGHDFHNKQFLDLNLCLVVLWSSGLQFPTVGGGGEGGVWVCCLLNSRRILVYLSSTCRRMWIVIQNISCRLCSLFRDLTGNLLKDLQNIFPGNV